MDSDKSEKTCPSAPLSEGATLIGALGGDGHVHHFKTPMVADADFVAKAKAKGGAERHLRFASKCETSGCKQWTGTKCGIIESVLEDLAVPNAPPVAEELPPCVIRGSCRWFAQRAEAACRACHLVVTDTRELA
jgi:hypothetical protein